MMVILAFLLGVIAGVGMAAMCVVSSEADRKAGEQDDSDNRYAEDRNTH